MDERHITNYVSEGNLINTCDLVDFLDAYDRGHGMLYHEAIEILERACRVLKTYNLHRVYGQTRIARQLWNDAPREVEKHAFKYALEPMAPYFWEFSQKRTFKVPQLDMYDYRVELLIATRAEPTTAPLME